MKVPEGELYRPLPIMVPLPPKLAEGSVDVKIPTPVQLAVPRNVAFTRVKVPGVEPEELKVPFYKSQRISFSFQVIHEHSLTYWVQTR